jgi:hypothetical protein
MSTPSPRQGGLQFTLAALLAAMTLAALFCVALARPTRFWSEMAMLIVLLCLLTSVSVIVYRSGRTRAFAVGFLVFTLGFLAALVSREFLLHNPQYGYANDEFLSSHLGTWLFAKIHPNNYQPSTGVTVLGMSDGFDSGTGSTVTGIPGGLMGPTMMQPKYDPTRFQELIHAACALLSGLLGGLVTQVLYATQKGDP